MPRSRSWSLESMARSVVRLVGSEDAGLGQELVHQGGLAVVDVGDDGDVAKVHSVSMRIGGRQCGGRSVEASCGERAPLTGWARETP